jgi:hypothetical protein
MIAKDIYQFYNNFSQEVIYRAELEEEESMREWTFTTLMIDYLQDVGEAEDGINCNHFNKRYGTKLNAYYVNDEGSSVDIFVSIFKTEKEPVTVIRTDAEAALERARRFLVRSLSNKYYTELDEANNDYDLAHYLAHYSDYIENVRIILLTNGVIKSFDIQNIDINGISVNFQVWDIERLFRLLSSGKRREEIIVDLEELCGTTIPCIVSEIPKGGYDVCLTSIPGEILVKIYEKYGSRLLERNVRTFLQLRGNVNKGIRKTLEETPEMFLAYNNGISATTAEVVFDSEKGQIRNIKKLTDFQIVNGGQTTASLYHAARKSKSRKKGQQAVDLSQVYVQAKISIIKDFARMDDIVPNISQYANSQNRIQMADFSANDPYHRKIEELSRTIWAPAKGGGDRQTKWFYERMRGQYDDNRNMAPTPKLFLSEYDPKQKFDKTDLSKYENCWDMQPHIVSKGRQDSFKNFAQRQVKSKVVPDQKYYEHLIAKAILFRHIQEETTKQFGATYRANIVAYSFSYLAYKTANKIDLDTIWKMQNVMPSLAVDIEKLISFINDYIRQSAGDRNVTQWCRQEECWKGLKEKDITLSDMKKYIITRNGFDAQREQSSIEMTTEKDNSIIDFIRAVPGDIWKSVSAWAKDTNNLQAWQRAIAFSIGKLEMYGKSPSIKQAKQGIIILQEASHRGFALPEFITKGLENIDSTQD